MKTESITNNRSFYLNRREQKRNVVFYGRVSTEHEAQLDAFENQMQWYDEQARYHPNWNVIRKYVDKGITGTQAKKRPSFMKMINDAQSGEFDLIVTREVCRFARNTVDTLQYTRDLKANGVEVYFIEDNIWTMDGDGELRLTIMATLAQEESRKTSERVKAGQKISRENGVLYGSGNVLGYDRVDGTYVINEEQAETVQLIYFCYLQGLGMNSIAYELCKLERKNSIGNVKWDASSIGRILKNPIYKGVMRYGRYKSSDYLTQKRVVEHDVTKYSYALGDFTPIITEDDWDSVQQIINKKSQIVAGYKRGKKFSEDVWIRKLQCSCGYSCRRDNWRTNKNGEKIYGYRCYNQANFGSKKNRERRGLNSEGCCDNKTIADWKLELMAKKVFEQVWVYRKETVIELYQTISELYVADEKLSESEMKKIKNNINKTQKKIDNLIEMRAEGEIDKEEYFRTKTKLDEQLKLFNNELNKTSKQNNGKEKISENLKIIYDTLNEYIDFSKDKIAREIIDKFVIKIKSCENSVFKWTLNLLGYQDENNGFLCSIEGRKNNPTFISFDEKKSIPFINSATGCY